MFNHISRIVTIFETNHSHKAGEVKQSVAQEEARPKKNPSKAWLNLQKQAAIKKQEEKAAHLDLMESLDNCSEMSYKTRDNLEKAVKDRDLGAEIKEDVPKLRSSQIIRTQNIMSALDSDLLERYNEFTFPARQTKGTLNPRSSTIRKWDLLIVVLLVYTATVTPYEVSFLATRFDTLFFLNRMVDLCFTVDMITAFFLPFQKLDGTWVDTPRAISYHYLRGFFMIDVFSVLPYDFVSLVYDNQFSSNLKMLRILKLMRLAKLLRVLRAGRILVRWESQMALDYSHIRLMTFVMIVLAASHWLACAWHMLKIIEDNRELSDTGMPTDGYINWVNEYQYLDGRDGVSSKYIAALYWAVATLSTLGYGDIVPTTDVERFFVCVSALIGASIYAYMVGAVCGIVAGMNESSTAFYQQMDNLNSFMKEKNLPQSLRETLREFFRFRRFHGDLAAHQDLMSAMSPKLRGAVSEHVHAKWIMDQPIFMDAPSEFYTEMAMVLIHQAFCVRECVVKYGETNQFMHIVERGLVVSQGRLFTRGKVVGEDMMQADRHRRYNAITLTHTILFSLSREKLYTILEAFPEMKARMRWRLVRKVFREAILIYAQTVRETQNSNLVTDSTRSLQQHFYNSDLTDSILRHRIRILKLERKDEFNKLEEKVCFLQSLYRVKQAKEVFKKRKDEFDNSTTGELRMQQLLNSLHLDQHQAVFMKEKIDIVVLRKLTITDLRVSTEIPIGDCVVILEACHQAIFPSQGPNLVTAKKEPNGYSPSLSEVQERTKIKRQVAASTFRKSLINPVFSIAEDENSPRTPPNLIVPAIENNRSLQEPIHYKDRIDSVHAERRSLCPSEEGPDIEMDINYSAILNPFSDEGNLAENEHEAC